MSDKSILATYTGTIATAVSDGVQAPSWLTYLVGGLTALYTLLKIIGWCYDRYKGRHNNNE